MKMTKPGKIFGKKWVGTCTKCGAEYEDTESNVKKEGTQRDCTFFWCEAKKTVNLYPKNQISKNCLKAPFPKGSELW